jgi:hypothetical protein
MESPPIDILTRYECTLGKWRNQAITLFDPLTGVLSVIVISGQQYANTTHRLADALSLCC